MQVSKDSRPHPSKEEVQAQQSWCTVCEKIYGGRQFSENLWLEARGGRDYLVCKLHRRKHEKRKSNGR